MRDETLTARLLLAASVIAGASYILSWSLPLPDAASTVWKGAGVALLAAYATLRARSLNGALLAAMMALGALGDVLLETHGLTVGAAAFLAGHVAAIGLYLRNRAAKLSPSRRLLALVLVPATMAIAFLLPADRAMAPGGALYALGLSLMAACAWTSRFPRFRTGVGAMMFLASDLLIFAQAGALGGAPGVGVAIWCLYYLGQLLICIGVAGTLSKSAAV